MPKRHRKTRHAPTTSRPPRRPFGVMREGPSGTEFAITDMPAAARFVATRGYGHASDNVVRVTAGMILSCLRVKHDAESPAERIEIDAFLAAHGVDPDGMDTITVEDVIEACHFYVKAVDCGALVPGMQPRREAR